jgi:hypothetical protein
LPSLAEHLENAELQARDVTKITDDHPEMDWDDAYAIQDEIRRRKETRGHKTAGLKAGLTRRVPSLALSTPRTSFRPNSLFDRAPDMIVQRGKALTSADVCYLFFDPLLPLAPSGTPLPTFDLECIDRHQNKAGASNIDGFAGAGLFSSEVICRVDYRPCAEGNLFARVLLVWELVELDVVQSAADLLYLTDVDRLHHVARFRVDHNRPARAGDLHSFHHCNELVGVG